MSANIMSLVNWIFTQLRRYKLERLFKYGLVGACAAATHAAMAAWAYYLFLVPATASNFIGFICGGGVSYLGSYYFTFKIKSGHKNALPRFAIAWAVGIFVNIGVFKVLLDMFNPPFIVNVLVAIVLTPILQFIMLRFWAFRHSIDGKDV